MSELFVSKRATAEAEGGFLHLSIPSGDTVLRLALTPHAAIALHNCLMRETPLLRAAPDGDLIKFPKPNGKGKKAARIVYKRGESV